MIPDILGYNLKDGIKIIRESGIDDQDILIEQYTSPRGESAGDDARILRVDLRNGKIILIIGNF